ncbi:MAG: acyltransferase [Clostridiales bacterium]|nr:acyltransferase [Clostridiales bacterium]
MKDILNLPYIISAKYRLILTQIWYKHFFKSIGKHSRILKPLRLVNTRYITLGNNVYIDKYVYMVTDSTPCYTANLVIGDGTKIGNYNHIACVNEVIIGKNVLTADWVYISDNYHAYNDIEIPIKNQGVASKGKTSIGDNSWLGDKVSVISCSIGRNCIIGANSVVLHDIDDFCIAVGSPAKVVKKYNHSTKMWEKVK